MRCVIPLEDAGARPRGIEVGPVTAWLSAHVGATPPLTLELITGGHSNLTYKVTDARGERFVLRRPPLHHVLPTAHDMGREHRVISALGPTPVPVPSVLGWCPDPDVTGAPFYVMGFVDGQVLHDAEITREVLPEERRVSTARSFIDVLADLHAVDPDAVGLSDLGRKEGYIHRQLRRWHQQWQQSKTREIPAVDTVHDALSARVPEQGPAAVVHGDYRLGNCLCSDDGRIVAVLDWEICTLGDPMADLGYVLATWQEPNAPATEPGFPPRQEILARYTARSGRDTSLIDFYVAFSYWKSACIVEGVYNRYLAGAVGETTVDIAAYGPRVERLAAEALQAVERL